MSKIRVSLILSLVVLSCGVGRAFVPQTEPAPSSAGSLLITGGTLIDGSGARRRKVDVRVANGVIQAIGRLKPQMGERVINARNLIVAPGFIDTHSHADGGLLET